ncbi:COP9 signalosome complex subunit 8 [Centruroides vittatus]|uniref:COP9 signalosome complex subunit 8 n=1 Tax=Centruroides vittatus TaxID=120091 RepID=UPI00350F2097
MAATTMETKDYSVMSADLEKRELESPGGIATPQTYGQLLAIYLFQNDLPNAKLLWKRIPQGVKEANPELGQIWIVGQKLWNRDFPELYKSLDVEWPEHILPIMKALMESTRTRALHLAAKAYSSISIEDASLFLGLPPDKTIEEAVAFGWTNDRNQHLIMPKKPDVPTDGVAPSEEQLAKLTDFVVFLEN